jgi:NAD(P)-dependent dehydrogenase (short-subunit alcohol dehydrogenase family)
MAHHVGDGSGRLGGRRALVTGAANGQGKAVVQSLVAEGARVVAFDTDRDGVEALATVIGRDHCIPVAGDVGEEVDVASAVGRAFADLGGLDALYNNAGIYLRDRGDGHVDTIDAATWRHVMAVNLDGVYLFCKHAIPLMLHGGRGAIVNVASTAGIIASEYHAYSASKGAVVALTRSIASSYASRGIRCNVIAPGMVQTGMIDSIVRDPEAARRFADATPLGRFATVEEIASVAVFLLSDESSYITGTVLPVDGGITAR